MDEEKKPLTVLLSGRIYEEEEVTKDIEIRQAVDACSNKAIVEHITRYKIHDSAYKTKYG